jgi:hypothetical protein
MQRCAPEIWCEILRQINRSKSKRDHSLKAMSLVFKALAPYAQAELFRTVNVDSVANAQRLLEVARSNSRLLRNIKSIKLTLSCIYEDPSDLLWIWLAGPDALELLPYFGAVVLLELNQGSRNGAPHAEDIERIFQHFKSVKHLRLNGYYVYNDFREIAALLCMFRSTLRHLDVDIGPEEPYFLGAELNSVNGITNVLNARALADYTPLDALPHLEFISLMGTIPPELVEWLLRSGAADCIYTLEVDPETSTDLAFAGVLLARGCKQLDSLVLCMMSGGWFDEDPSISRLSLRQA